MSEQSPFRQLPSVDRLLQAPAVRPLLVEHGRVRIVEAIRQVLDQAREAIRAGQPPPSQEALLATLEERLSQESLRWLQPVINATGVIIHTNLGRAPLSPAARQAIAAVAQGYSNLEYDLVAGRRGGRGYGVERLLTQITGAEAALAVNNNASAVLLALTVLAAGRAVVISRGQLVEIGGRFRIPDVMAQSGARLVEVGTTNRTHLDDYRRALEVHEDVALLLRAHRSNFRIIGFTTEPPLEALARLAHERGLWLMDDLGSGALLETERFGLAHEPTVQESIAAGADIVCFSGDKLLGGPQAGLIVGRKPLLDRIRRHPLARAVRMDKIALAGLQATLEHYLRGEAVEQVPVWRMIATPADEVRRRAQRWVRRLRRAGLPVQVIAGCSTVGGGSLPGETLPTWLVALALPSPDAVAARLRRHHPPIIARIEEERLVLDPRTVLPEQERTLLEGMVEAATGERMRG
ncbi:MAG TPA: L-seryl-tRNA(Sec) selenium transferase [Chloroflexi bacterium]|nr:L-seryl-tRNA(Sec) selenium transferase [Chloroflexota bacterium]